MCSNSPKVFRQKDHEQSPQSPSHEPYFIPRRRLRKSASPLINRTMNQAKPPLVQGQKVWCSRCGEYVKIVRVATAAKIVDTDRRTIYNYVKKSKVQVFKVAGGTLRVCSQCLLRDEE